MTPATSKARYVSRFIAIEAGEQRFEQMYWAQAQQLHVQLAQITPTGAVLSVRPGADVCPELNPPALLNLSIVAEEGISLTELVSAPVETPMLPRQELVLLNLLARGVSHTRIAQLLGVTQDAVVYRAKIIRQHFNVDRTMQAIAAATSHGLIADWPLDLTTWDHSHADLLDPEFRVSPHHTTQSRITSIDTHGPSLQVALHASSSRYITIGRDDHQRRIAVGTRGRVHVCQIRRPLAGPNHRRRRAVLLASARGLTNAEIAREHGISPRTVRRHLAGLLSSLNNPRPVPAKAVAAQTGLDPSSAAVHQPARAWCETHIYAADMQPDTSAIPDDVSPIFTTFDS